jgi:peptide deformylase
MKNEPEIILIGNPTLRKISEPIHQDEYGTSELHELSNLLFHIMKVQNGLGLAAPQIGINKRAIVFGMEQHPIHKQIPSIPFTILFNPTFTPITNNIQEKYEGCLSVGDLRGKVPRYTNIIYQGYDADGNLIEREALDLHARVIQHEIDHLDGIVFIDRVKDTLSFGFHNELIKYGAL